MWIKSLPLLLILISPVCIATTPTDFVFTRAMYGPWNMTELGDARFDAFYHYFDWTWELSQPGITEERMGPTSILAAENGIKFIAGQYYLQPSWKYITFDYAHAVGPSGVVETRTPSPVSEDWWLRMVEEPAIFIANLSLHYPIWGIVWDIELYGHDAFLREHYSYDDESLAIFANQTGITIPQLGTSTRVSWLRNNDLLDSFHKWEEDKAYRMAERTRAEVHAINPNLSLGLLGFDDSWFHWTILRAWNSSTAPVTAWCEQTYGGYRIEGRGGVAMFQQKWVDYGLNGKFLPGLRAWVESIEAAIRHNGAFWIYQYNGHPFSEHGPGLKERYTRLYRAVDDFFFFKTQDAHPLPIFDILPGIQARPYVAKNGTCSALLLPHGDYIDTNTTIVTNASLKYMWFDRILQTVQDDCYVGELGGPNPVLSPEDFPCIIYGLTEEDLRATEAFALIEETELILSLHEAIGLEVPTWAQETLQRAREDYNSQRFPAVIDKMLGNRSGLYMHGLNEIWPEIEAGLSNPRESELPLQVLRDISMAKDMLERGEERKGEQLLTRGFKMIASVPEMVPILVLLSFLTLGKSPNRSRLRDTPECL